MIPALVRQVRHEADDVVSLLIERADGGDLPPWGAGSHIDLELPTGITRQYSLCGDPSDRRSYRIAVQRDAASRGGSEYVHMFLRAGQRLNVGGPRNHFALVGAESYWFIAGGIGITPILALAREAAQRAPVSVLYLGRGTSSLAFRDEIVAAGGAVTLYDSQLAGRADLGALLAGVAPGDAVYACGSGRLLDAVEEFAAAWPPGVLHTERFTPRPRAAAVATAFEMVWQPQGRSIAVPASRSALDAAQAAGLPVVGSCREGVCGTCELVVVEGVADHRDDVVDDHAVADGERFFPCVSRASSPTLTVRAP